VLVYFFIRYSNIFVTAPSPENLKTLFDFMCKGINALEYKVLSHYLVLVLKICSADVLKILCISCSRSICIMMW
jgi:tRNA(Met) C34 N-acetyltransferase TmcA